MRDYKRKASYHLFSVLLEKVWIESKFASQRKKPTKIRPTKMSWPRVFETKPKDEKFQS